MRRLTTLLVLAVVITPAGQFIFGSSPASAQIVDSMTIRGRVSFDGAPASANAIVSVFGASGENLASAFTGMADAPDEYEITVIINSRLVSGEVITVDIEPGLGPSFVFVRRIKTRALVGATVTANLAVFTSVPSVVKVPDGGTSFASIPEFVSIAPEASASASGVGPVTVLGGSINVPMVGGDLTIPVAVPVAETLESLDDPVKGISLVSSDEGSLLRIPFDDDSANEAISLLVETTQFIGDGTSATAQVTGLAIETPTRSLLLSGSTPGLDAVSIKLIADVTAYPADADLEMRLKAVPDEDALSRIDGVFDPSRDSVAEIAFASEFVDTNFDDVLGAVTLRLGVSRTWLENHAGDSVEVFRIGDDGSVGRSTWISLDPESDPAQFDLVSTDGLATIVVAAIKHVIEPTATPSPTPTPVILPTPTSTPRPVPTPTSLPAPTATPEPVQSPVPVPTASAISTASPTPTATPEVRTAATETADNDESNGGGSCSAPASGGPASIGHLGLLVLPAGLLVVRRF